MLHALLQYAQQVGVTGEAGFKRKRIRWLLQFSPHGEYLGLVPAGDPRTGREFACVPHLQFSGSTPMRQFLVDTARFVVLYGEETPGEKLQHKHRYFLDRLRDASAVEPILGRIAYALADPQVRQQIQADLDQQSPMAKPTDNMTFVEMRPDGPRILAEDDSWHQWWRSYWPNLFESKKAKKKATRMRCFLSGALVEPNPTHPKIKGLGDVGGNVETTLVGFNRDAFCSYGLQQSANAAVGVDSSEMYAAALNDVLAHQSRRLAGARAAFWYTHDIPRTEDPLELLLGGDDLMEVAEEEPEPARTHEAQVQATAQAVGRAAQLLEAIHRGQLPALEECQYRALILSGNAGRVVVRDWMEGQFEQLMANVSTWFADLAIVHRYGNHRAAAPKFLAVIAATVRELKDASAPLTASLWRAAVTGSALPYEAMARALSRARMDFLQAKPANHARLGLLKAYLIRKEICPMTPELSDEITHPAYLCGRIMAVLAGIQQKALGDVGVGIAQRYYGAASATPALVLGRLVRLAQTGHLPKIDPPALRRWYETQLAELWNGLRQPVPTTLTLEEQTLFAMGYYHQRASRRAVDSPQSSSEQQNQ